MINLRYFNILFSLSAICVVTAAEKVGTATESRLCMSNQIGMDYVEASVNKMFDQYVKRWNNYEHPVVSIQKVKNAGNTAFGGENFLIVPESKEAAVDYDLAKGKNKIQFNLPIFAKSLSKQPDGTNQVTFKDTISVSVEVAKHQDKNDVSQWNLNLVHNIKSFNCHNKDKKTC